MANRTPIINFTYNGYTPTLPVGKYNASYNDESITYAMEFVITAATADALETAVLNAINTLTAWNKDFTLTLGATATREYHHADNTAFLPRPTCIKVGSPFDTGRSQKMMFSITLQRPTVDRVSNNEGFRDGREEISQEANGRYTVSVSARYTATPAYTSPVRAAKTAQENVEANFATYADSVMSAIATRLSISEYERIVPPSYGTEDEDKLGTATTIYREVSSTESDSGSGYDSELVLTNFVCSAVPQSVGIQLGIVDTGGPQKKETAPMIWRANYTTTLSPTATDEAYQKYIEDISAFLITECEDRVGLALGFHKNFYVENIDPSFNEFTGEISVTLSGTVLGPKKIKMYNEVMTYNEDDGVAGDKRRDGNPDSHFLYSIGRTLTAFHAVAVVSYDSQHATEPPDLGGNWVRKGRTNVVGPFTNIGVTESRKSDKRRVKHVKQMYAMAWHKNYIYAVAPSGGGSTTSGGRTAGGDTGDNSAFEAAQRARTEATRIQRKAGGGS